MTPHPSTLKAAREIERNGCSHTQEECDANQQCQVLIAEDAASIESRCHVSEMVEALRACSENLAAIVLRFQKINSEFELPGADGRTAFENASYAKSLLAKVMK